MSWLTNPFKSLQLFDEEQGNSPNNPISPTIGVKEDISAIGRQLISFISPETPSNSGESSRTFEGIRNDLEEIKGTFKSSLSLISSNRAVSEISKLASNFLQFNDENDVDFVNRNMGGNMIKKNDDGDDDGNDDDDDDDDDGVGINDGVIQFAQQISNRPELWTEFPLSLDDYDFDISEVQYEHASIIEQLVPSLADLRSRISSHMNDKKFWMIYFILLLPRLNEEDSELLSTLETVEARETLLKMLRAKKNEEINSENPTSDSDSEVHDKPIINNRSLENVRTSKISIASRSVKSDAKPESDSWKEKRVITGTSAGTLKEIQIEDDVSFSDLEDEGSDLPNRRSSSRPSQLTATSSPEGSNEWVQLNSIVKARGSQVKGQSSLRERDSEGEDSTGWLTVDDFEP
ncbi:uncharacterized protein LOC130815977 [Amaranthus tricolor]|uniref:uncharacterized protein LOC130815977 n=1 Tax=Amaranthus tricolor TaxID=29722 RepID=UPI00258857D3|nr:uncharacterized protein LOC130815977 [Amaranthus tricolor]